MHTLLIMLFLWLKLILVFIVQVHAHTLVRVTAMVHHLHVVAVHVRTWLRILVTCLVVTFILGVYLFVFELFIVHARGVSSSGTVKLIIQLLPSAFLPFVGWFVRYMSKCVNSDVSAQGTQNQHSTEHTPLLQQQPI